MGAFFGQEYVESIDRAEPKFKETKCPTTLPNTSIPFLIKIDISKTRRLSG